MSNFLPDWSLMSQQLNDQWKFVWLQAVALSWRSQPFKELLCKDPRQALAQYFNYNLASNLTLIVEEIPEAERHTKYGYSVEGDNGWVLPNMVVKIALPPKPKDLRDEGVALADFAVAGRTYPFSTC